MTTYAPGSVAVIFVAQRTEYDEEGYAQAATRMELLASRQAGFLGIDSVRGPNGSGITVSYWADELTAKRWRDYPEHITIREFGREKWYSSYSLHVTAISRSYDWTKAL